MTIMSCEFESHFLHEEKIFAEIAQLVEHNLAKVRVASSSLVFRSFREIDKCWFLFFYVISLLLLADNIYICARNI